MRVQESETLNNQMNFHMQICCQWCNKEAMVVRKEVMYEGISPAT